MIKKVIAWIIVASLIALFMVVMGWQFVLLVALFLVVGLAAAWAIEEIFS